MNLGEELTGYLNKVDESRKDISSINDWWEANHKEEEPFLLSGTSGKDVWRVLDIQHIINANKKILNIGVGLGHCTRELNRIGAKIHALDISSIALKRVENYVEHAWFPSQLPDLPKNYYDLAISHLVAQHMSDADLLYQIEYVVKSLKPGGFFAIQIAFPKQKDYQLIESFDTQKWGGVLRSLKHIHDLVEKAGGKTVWVDKIGDFPDFEVGWYGLHIVRNDSNSIIEYQSMRLNKKISKLIEIEGDYYSNLGKIDKAFELYSEAFVYDDENLSNLKKCGELYYQKGEKLKALEFFNKAYRFYLNDLEAVIIIGQIYIELGEILKAYDIFIEFKNKQPAIIDDIVFQSKIIITDALITLGDVYYSSGLYAQSNKIYEVLLKLIPGDRLLMNKINEIENQSEETVDNLLLKLRLAELAIEESRFDTARLILEDILSHDSKNISALIDLGVLNALETKNSEALHYFEKVLEIEPSNEIALENLRLIESF